MKIPLLATLLATQCSGAPAESEPEAPQRPSPLQSAPRQSAATAGSAPPMPRLTGVWERSSRYEEVLQVVFCPDGAMYIGYLTGTEPAAARYELRTTEEPLRLRIERPPRTARTYVLDRSAPEAGYRVLSASPKMRVAEYAVDWDGDTFALSAQLPDESGEPTPLDLGEYTRTSQVAPCGDAAPPLSGAAPTQNYFRAATQKPDERIEEGEVLPKPIPTALSSIRGVALLALPAERATWSRYAARRVVVVNGKRRRVEFGSRDSMIPLHHEAQDALGTWHPIEFTPKSWCHVSKQTRTLPGRSMWSFTAPIYTGSLPTKLRLRLDTPAGPIYSNEFDGTISPEQFLD